MSEEFAFAPFPLSILWSGKGANLTRVYFYPPLVGVTVTVGACGAADVLADVAAVVAAPVACGVAVEVGPAVGVGVGGSIRSARLRLMKVSAVEADTSTK